MPGPLSADENAALMARLGWAQPAPAPAPAPPPEMGAPQMQPNAMDPTTAAIIAANRAPGGPAQPAPQMGPGYALPVTQLPPQSLQNAHTAPPSLRGDFSRAIGQDQTVGYTPPPQQAGASMLSMPPMGAQNTAQTSSGSSTTVQKGIPISAATKEHFRHAEADAIAANAKAQDAQTEMTAARIQGADQQAATMKAQGEEMRALTSANQNELGRKRQHLEAMISDVQNERIDPDRFWNSRSTGQKIGAAIALMAGGFQAGWAKTGHNMGAEQLNQLVSNDIHAQETSLANRRAGVQAQSQLYEMTKGEFHDHEERLKAAHVAGLAEVQKQIESRMVQAQDPIERARLLDLKSGIEQKFGEATLRLDEVQANKVSSTSHSSTTAGGPRDMSAQIKMQGLIVTGPDGKPRLARSEAEGQKLREGVSTTQNIQSNIDEAIKLRQQLSVAHPIDSAQVYSRLKSLQAETAQLVTVARGQGAMSKGDQDVADTAIGKMTSLDPLGRADAVLSSTRDRFGQQFARELDAHTVAMPGEAPAASAPSSPYPYLRPSGGGR